MRDVDLKAYYNKYHSGEMTVEQIAAEIYRNTDINSILRHYNLAVHGYDVKDDIAKLTVLLTAYFDKVVDGINDDYRTIVDIGDAVSKAWEKAMHGKDVVNMPAGGSKDVKA